MSYTFENADLKIIFLRQRIIYNPEHTRILNTLNVSSADPKIQELFTKQFKQLTRNMPSCDDIDLSYLANKNVYVFPSERHILIPANQFEIRFFADESSMNTKVFEDEEEFKQLKQNKTSTTSPQKKICILK